MTRVDFYYDVPNKLAIAVKLAHKAFSQRLPLAIYTSQPPVAEQIDRLLRRVRPGFQTVADQAHAQLAAAHARVLGQGVEEGHGGVDVQRGRQHRDH